jgi:hypothetical protein
MRKLLLVVFGALPLAIALPSGMAAASVTTPHDFAADMNGLNERPTPVTTPAHGELNLKISEDGTRITYQLSVENLKSAITQAHIHLGPQDGVGSAGPIVVFLFPANFPGGPLPAPVPGEALQVDGTFTSADLIGPLAGKPLSALIAEIRNGNAYANLHTALPGGHPGGEIRGQLKSQELQQG